MDILDRYLNENDSMGSGKLSDDEFDNQLLGSASNKTGDKAAQPVQQEKGKGGLDVSALLAKAFETASEEAERDSEVRNGIKMASHGVRVLGTLYTSIIKNVDFNDSEKVSSVMRDALKVVRDDAYKVTRACGLSDDEVPAWLHSQISGQVMELVANAIERNNGTFNGSHKSQYLQPIIEAVTAQSANGISATYYANPSDPDLQITNALMMATASVMAEYQAFTYFNSDSKAVARQITEILKERVIDETLADATKEWGLSDRERAYIGSSLLSHAGNLLASSWANNVIPTIEYVKSLETSERQQILASGYPLDVVFEDFENFYGGLEVSAQASLEMMRAQGMGKSNDLAADTNESPSPSVQSSPRFN